MPAPPPPPPAPTLNLGGSSPDQSRGALLQSIRAGKQLRKTVTVDKSAPTISGKVHGESSTTSSNINSKGPTANTNAGNSINNGNPIGLGGLFSGGMPKLKPTGMRTSLTERDNGNVSPHTGSATLPSVKRGPPPIPPPAAQKPQLFAPNAQSVEHNANHNPETPRASFGKPTLAPKPPSSNTVHQKPSPPPKKLNLTTGNSVSRAQSMRLPRSPPVLAPTPPSLHQSQDCLNEPQQRPSNRILRPPVARPPSPPTSRSSNNGATVTRVAPPPPCRAPTMPPPPPPPLPHRTVSTTASAASNSTRLAPSVPPPPTPPTRGQSYQQRNGQSSMLSGGGSPAEFEARYAEMFHSIATFPAPEPFRGVTKVYNSKTVAAAKQQAPAPPLRSVSSASSSLHSSSMRQSQPPPPPQHQWQQHQQQQQQQQNAASSAC